MDITPLGAGTAPKRDLAQASAAAIDPAKAKADADAQKAAEAFEANFIGEMLKESGVNSVSDSFGGGAGEEAFSSFLTQEYAKKVAENGGLGLAEHIFEAIKQRGFGRMIGALFGSSRQEKVLKLLDQEHAVILKGPLGELAALVERREAAMEEILTADGDPTEGFLAAVKAKAERNSRLLLASIAGVRSAADQIGQIRAAGTRLRTYGADGHSVELRQTEVTRDKRA